MAVNRHLLDSRRFFGRGSPWYLAEPAPCFSLVSRILCRFTEVAMSSRSRGIVYCPFLLLVLTPTVCAELPTLANLVPFRKRVEADPGRDYRLAEENGPWLIMAASFEGDDAVPDAQELVFELRKRFNLKAYFHEMTFKFDDDSLGTAAQLGGTRRTRYQTGEKSHEVAVLVGDFEAVDDSDARKTLEKIKYGVFPHCLGEEENTTLAFASIRRFQRQILRTANAEVKKGPLGHAFITTNPLIPPEYFAPRGVDKFVEEINEDLKYSLLNCPGNYTVQVAKFQGTSYVGDHDIGKAGKKAPSRSRLEEAAHKANVLTRALRSKGWEAYEFHDRSSSIVTIESFASPGRKLPGGGIQLDPRIQQIVQTFQAERSDVAWEQQTWAHQFAAQKGMGAFAALGLQPKTLRADGSIAPANARKPLDRRGLQWKGEFKGIDTIPFDMVPQVVKVPRRAISKDYHRAVDK